MLLFDTIIAYAVRLRHIAADMSLFFAYADAFATL